MKHVRAVCITCGQSRSVVLKGIEGDSGAVKSETCDDCRTYAKMLYPARDIAVDPVRVAEAEWSRHAPNPLLLIG